MAKEFAGPAENTFAVGVGENTKVQAVRIKTKKSRLIRVWFYVAVLFSVISVIAVVLTGEPKAIIVVAMVAFVMGCIGSLMAAFSPAHRLQSPVFSTSR
jgi:archaellum biogenesis protein FlaJ (TadC family)